MDLPTDDRALCDEQLAAPPDRIWPEPGEVFYAQIGLGGVSLGEAALVVGPDGTRVLIDVGNDAHDDDVTDLLTAVTAQMNQRGFTPRDPAVVEHVLITHLHADHADGLEDLLGNVSVSGTIVHRGLVDVAVANPETVAQFCRSLALAPGASRPLCEGVSIPSCDPSTWIGVYPSSGCDGLAGNGASLTLGSSVLQVVAINGHIAGTSYQQQIGPLRTDDLNGENARSAVGVLTHGSFRLLVSGDLTAQSPDSDPVEEFYASYFPDAAGLSAAGVDVVHLAHHGRDSSNSLTWLDRVVPSDGASRNAVVGISAAHLGSPHREVLDNVLAAGRLGDGRIWATRVAVGGANDQALVHASGGHLLIATRHGGNSYVVQAIGENGAVVDSRAFHSVAACLQ